MTLPTNDDPRVARALSASVLLRALDALIAIVWDAAGGSRTGMAVKGARQQWRDRQPSARLTMIGVALLTASLVHIGLTVTHEMPPGWLWVVPPAIAATIGMLLLAGARRDLKA